MKKINFLIVAFAMTFTSINITCKKEQSLQCVPCNGLSYHVQDFSSIEGVIKKVADGEPYYDGRKYYILVQAQKYLKPLYNNDSLQYERIFPCSKAVLYTDSDTGKTTKISGQLSKCTTADHGLTANLLITFNTYK